MFTRHDARWLADSVRSLHGARDVRAFGAAAMAALDRKFDLHSFACEELSLGGAAYTAHALRCGTKPPADHVLYFHDNPFGWVIGAEAPPPVLHMRGDVPDAQWERTDHFNGLARAMGWCDQMLLVARSRPSFVSVGMHRDVRFSERERGLVALLQPHISAAWTRVADRSLAPADRGLGVIRLRADLRPFDLSDGLHGVLRTYFPRWRWPRPLPDEVTDWVRHSLNLLEEPAPSHPLFALAAESVRGRLLIRCFPEPAGGATVLRLVEVPADPDFRGLRHKGLTARECEVIHWIALGKRDGEIAAILGLSGGTVAKHAENIRRKLAAETRAAAVHAAREALRAFR